MWMEVVKNGLKGTISSHNLRKVYPSHHGTFKGLAEKVSRLSCFGEITQPALMKKAD
jgi:hypothetical protein